MNADYYIEKLKARVLENPGSRLFLTLAEELRKREELEEALTVLKSGIEKNPAFAAARLTLGRWLFKDNKFREARKEFSAVLDVCPGDGFATRYLGEIDMQLEGENDDVRRRTVERLNDFREAVRKRFSAGVPDGTAAGDR
ncbi:MAG TPA: tetratricopeptide repeat protein [Dissulfurispiraceae bacterium]|nr:tetratricopeptide repeat protein [Dissulfurispiraceae bacterium]